MQLEQSAGLSRSCVCRQVLGACGSICLYFSNGFLLGLRTQIIPNLKPTSYKSSTKTEWESWMHIIAVSIILAMQLISGLLADKYGRKKIVAASLVPNIIAYCLIYLTKDPLTVSIAFTVSSLSNGGLSIGPVFVAEICSPVNRGFIVNLILGSFPLGMAVAFMFGNVSNTTLSLIGNLPCIFGWLTTCACPESPIWLASVGKIKECKANYLWYRKDANELEDLLDYSDQKLTRKTSEIQQNQSEFLNAFNIYLHKGFIRAFFLSISCFVYVELSIKLIIGYCNRMIVALANAEGDYNITLYISVFCIFISLSIYSSCFLVYKFTRKSLILSTALISISLLLILLSKTFIVAKGWMTFDNNWISGAVISLYTIISCLGAIPTLLTVVCEIYPISCRGLGSSCNSLILSLITVLTSPLGFREMFVPSIVFISIALVYFQMNAPETGKKSLQKIDTELKFEGADENLYRKLDIKEKMLSCPYPIAITTT